MITFIKIVILATCIVAVIVVCCSGRGPDARA